MSVADRIRELIDAHNQQLVAEIEALMPELVRERVAELLAGIGGVSNMPPPVRKSPAAKSKPTAPAPKSGPTCSKCGKTGHNARSCGRAPKGHPHESQHADRLTSIRERSRETTSKPAAKRAPRADDSEDESVLLLRHPTIRPLSDGVSLSAISTDKRPTCSAAELERARQRIAERAAKQTQPGAAHRPRIAIEPRVSIPTLPVPRFTAFFDTTRPKVDRVDWSSEAE